MNILSRENARQLRSGQPFHLPPAAQPIGTTVELILEGLDINVLSAPDGLPAPIIVLSDERRSYEWSVVMSPNDSTSWKATVLLPSEPTVVYYYFMAGDQRLLEKRQVEGQNIPIYGAWQEIDFKIAVYDPDKLPADWTQGMVMYQIFPDRFANSNPNRPLSHSGVYGVEARFMKWGDLPETPPRGRDFFGGDLRGIIEKLPYLHDLGVDAIYLNPIFEATTNHRYDAINFMKIDPMLGTEADFDELVRLAHQFGIKLILDAVFNHCSSDSIYFDVTGKQTAATGIAGATQSKESPYYRWFRFKEWPTDYDGWFGFGFMPEFVECPEMEAYFLGENGVARHWLRRGIDGWRCDVAFDNTDQFWRHFRKALDTEKAGAYLVAEEWRDATRYFLGDMFDASHNYRFAWAVRGFLATGELQPSTFDDRLQTWLRDTPAPVIKAQMNQLDSHDTNRLMTACQGDRRKYQQAILFMLSYPGAPCIYYGSEAGLEGAFAEDGRRCMPWDHPDQMMHGFFKQAIHARRGSMALRLGEVETLVIDDSQRVYAFARRYRGESVYVAFNAGEQAARVVLPLPENQNGAFQDLLMIQPDVTAHNGKLTFELPAYSMVWYAR